MIHFILIRIIDSLNYRSGSWILSSMNRCLRSSPVKLRILDPLHKYEIESGSFILYITDRILDPLHEYEIESGFLILYITDPDPGSSPVRIEILYPLRNGSGSWILSRIDSDPGSSQVKTRFKIHL